MAQRTYTPESLTVTRTGKTYKADEFPRDIKDAEVTVRAFYEGEDLGTFSAHGWIEEGEVSFVLPDDETDQLLASKAVAKKPKAEKPEA